MSWLLPPEETYVCPHSPHHVYHVWNSYGVDRHVFLGKKPTAVCNVISKSKLAPVVFIAVVLLHEAEE